VLKLDAKIDSKLRENAIKRTTLRLASYTHELRTTSDSSYVRMLRIPWRLLRPHYAPEEHSKPGRTASFIGLRPGSFAGNISSSKKLSNSHRQVIRPLDLQLTSNRKSNNNSGQQLPQL